MLFKVRGRFVSVISSWLGKRMRALRWTKLTATPPRALPTPIKIGQPQLGYRQHWPVTVPPSAAAADALELSIQQSIFLVNVVISLAVCRLPVIDPFAI